MSSASEEKNCCHWAELSMEKCDIVREGQSPSSKIPLDSILRIIEGNYKFVKEWELRLMLSEALCYGLGERRFYVKRISRSSLALSSVKP